MLCFTKLNTNNAVFLAGENVRCCASPQFHILMRHFLARFLLLLNSPPFMPV